ncbi:MAG: hypothetical protein PQJ60_09995 [Spirochaetales bacterium]|nr:hypothetical protein [Spirochaetales bacterium]
MQNLKYIRCYTCGKHFPAQDAKAEHFCSDRCMAEFSRCPVCRKYFKKEPGREWAEYCSEECLKVERGDKTIEVTL